MYIARGVIHQAELRQVVEDAVRQLDPKIVAHVKFEFGDDSVGDPVVRFRITLTDPASGREMLKQVFRDVTTALDNAIRPMDDWGVMAHYSFRSESEQKVLNDPHWI